jgi:hypothetical protein
VRAVRRKLDGETGGASVNDLGTEVMVRASTMRAPGRAGPEKSAAAIRARARQSTPS